jgi:hypothetical protein
MKYQKNFHASLRSAQFFLSAPPPPNLKSWISPCMVLAIEVTDWDSSKSVAELNWYSKGILIYFSLELISTFKIILVTSWWTVEITGMPGEINLLCITFISIFVDFFVLFVQSTD